MMRNMLLAGAAGLALAGCVSALPDAPPPAPRYLIDSVSFPETGEAPAAWSLIVDDPLATRVNDTTKIALVRDPGRVEFYANGEWADRAPRLVQTALIRSFENTGRILAVGDRITQPRGDFVLQTDIRAMYAVYEGRDPAAMFSVYARILNGRGRVVAARLFEQKTPAGKDKVSDVAAAFDEAVGAVLADVVAWTFEEAGEAYAK